MRPHPFFLFRVAIFEMILLYITLVYLLEVGGAIMLVRI